LIRKGLISPILQPRGQFIHQLATLRKEFICAVYGRLINLKIEFLAQAQRRCFAREDEVRADDCEDSSKEHGLRTFTPPSLVDSDEYWHHVATKCFAFSTKLGPPTLFLTFTMKLYRADDQPVKQGREIFADSAISAIIFKTKLSALMQFIQKHEILGRVSGFVSRIEYQKRSLPHAHGLFWRDFETQDIQAVESVINVRYLKDSHIIEDRGMVSDFRQLIDAFQIHHYSKRFRLPNGKCCFSHSQ
jgi:hypothetical protein